MRFLISSVASSAERGSCICAWTFRRVVLTRLLLFTLCLSFSCSTSQQIGQKVEDIHYVKGGIVDMGGFTLRPPLGEGWAITKDVRSGRVDFTKYEQTSEPDKVLRIAGIDIYAQMLPVKYWASDKEEIAKFYWDGEIETILERGAKIGYGLADDEQRGTVTVNGKELHTLSYTIREKREGYMDDRQVQYLYFPDDFRETHVVHRFLVLEFADRGEPFREKHLETISPIISSFQVTDPDQLFKVCVNVLLRDEVSGGNLAYVRRLVEMGADLDGVTSTAFEVQLTPLIAATINGHIEIVRYLLDKGARIDMREGQYGCTALWAAASLGNTEIVRLLIDRGANVNAVCWENESVLSIARRGRHAEIIELLEEAGAK